MKIEEPKSDVLNDFLSHIFRVELGPELELQLGLFLHVLTQHFFVQLQPGGQALGVCILETEEPDLAKPDCLDDLAFGANSTTHCHTCKSGQISTNLGLVDAIQWPNLITINP